MEQLDSIKQDVKLAVRSLWQHKAWTAVVVATLALGIGANSALFTVVNAVLVRPLPYPQAERVLSLSESDNGVDQSVVSSLTYAAWAQSARSLSALAAYSPAAAVVRGSEEPEWVSGQLVTSSYFRVMGVRPARGRVFTEEEDRPGGPSLVVLSDQVWRRMFGGDGALIGRTVIFDGTPQTVIGVMPPSFTTARGAQYWVPMRLDPSPLAGTTFYYEVVGRIRPGGSVEAVRAELAALSRRLRPERAAEERGRAPVVMTVRDRRHGDTRPALLILLSAVGVVLLIACANVCNLYLARGARRQKEVAVRLALGASRWRLARYLLIESTILSLGGGVLGLLIPFVAVDWLVHMAPPTVAQVERIQVDVVVLGFTLAVALVTGVLFGLIPALEAGRTRLGQADLGTAGATISPRQNRLGRWLIVFELATALVLMTCAGLLTRSYVRVTSIDPGFRAEGVLVVDIDLPSTRYSTESAPPFFTELLERVRGFPGVAMAALADVPPLGGARMSVSTRGKDGRSTPMVDVTAVSPGYFATVGTPLLAGREFGAQDRAGGMRVTLINAALARAMYSSVNAVGQQIVQGATGATIIGVVEDVPQRELEAAARPALFLPVEQAGLATRSALLIRTRGDPLLLQQPVRRVLRSMDRELPVPTFTTLEQVLANAVAPQRFSFVLLTTFAVLAATLAAVGLYGVMSYLVADRRREIGVRIALGAEPQRLVRLVVGQGMRLAILGMLIGLGASIAAVGLLRHMLFGVSIYDPWTFAVGAALLGGVAVVACWVPARRAAHIQPVTVLRAE